MYWTWLIFVFCGTLLVVLGALQLFNALYGLNAALVERANEIAVSSMCKPTLGRVGSVKPGFRRPTSSLPRVSSLDSTSSSTGALPDEPPRDKASGSLMTAAAEDTKAIEMIERPDGGGTWAAMQVVPGQLAPPSMQGIL
jgi:hypothetical protein